MRAHQELIKILLKEKEIEREIIERVRDRERKSSSRAHQERESSLRER